MDDQKIDDQDVEIEISDELLEQSAGLEVLGGMATTYSNTGCRPAPCGCITN
jgi:hypothetical protein